METISYYQLLKYLKFSVKESCNIYVKFEKKNTQILIFSDSENENKLTGFYLNELKTISKKRLLFLFNENLGNIPFMEKKYEITQIQKENLELIPITEENLLKCLFPFQYKENYFENTEEEKKIFDFLKQKKFESVLFSTEKKAFVFPFFSNNKLSNFLFEEIKTETNSFYFDKKKEFFLTKFNKTQTKLNIFFSLKNLILFENEEKLKNENPDLLLSKISKNFIFTLLILIEQKIELLNEFIIYKNKFDYNSIEIIKFICYFYMFQNKEFLFVFSEENNKQKIHIKIEQKKILEVTQFYAELNKTLIENFNDFYSNENNTDKNFFFGFEKCKSDNKYIFTISFFKNYFYTNILIDKLIKFLKIPNLTIKEL